MNIYKLTFEKLEQGYDQFNYEWEERYSQLYKSYSDAVNRIYQEIENDYSKYKDRVIQTGCIVNGIEKTWRIDSFVRWTISKLEVR
jgi:hypothetical protein